MLEPFSREWPRLMSWREKPKLWVTTDQCRTPDAESIGILSVSSPASTVCFAIRGDQIPSWHRRYYKVLVYSVLGAWQRHNSHWSALDLGVKSHSCSNSKASNDLEMLGSAKIPWKIRVWDTLKKRGKPATSTNFFSGDCAPSCTMWPALIAQKASTL